MNKNKKRITILLAEDSTDEQTLLQQALAASHLRHDLYIVQDGEELLDYLHYRGQYSNKAIAPRPNLILLGLHLQKIDGFQALQAIKSNPQLRRIPIVVLTDSKSEQDIRISYELGASSYLAKPMTFELLVDAVNTLGDYWFDIVELPPTNTLE